MKRLLGNITDSLADAALLEMGVGVSAAVERHPEAEHESLMAGLKRFFQNFSITMADAALLEIGGYPVTPAEKHGPILRKRRAEKNIVHPDECQYGDNDACFV